MSFFHFFDRLPTELREEIWRQAVRPICRGVHFFTIHQEGGDSRLDAVDTEPVPKDGCSYYLGAPTRQQISFVPETWESWGDEGDGGLQADYNPSTYYMDGSLWVACQESRRVMQRHFCTINEHLEPEKNGAKDSPVGKRLASMEQKGEKTSYFVLKDGSGPRYFTIVPHADLFFFPSRTVFSLNWFNISREVHFASTKLHFPGVRNLGLLYRPEWSEEIQENKSYARCVEELRDLATSAEGLSHIWFIDTSLKRRPNVPTKEELTSRLPCVFEAADRRFEEVFDGISPVRSAWDCFGWGREDGGEPGHGSIGFVRTLQDAIYDWENEVTFREYRGPRVGVLACEYFYRVEKVE